MALSGIQLHRALKAKYSPWSPDMIRRDEPVPQLRDRPNQLRLLKLIKRLYFGAAVRNACLQKATGLDYGSMAGSLLRMERQKWIKKIWCGHNSVYWEITDAGSDALAGHEGRH